MTEPSAAYSPVRNPLLADDEPETDAAIEAEYRRIHGDPEWWHVY